ncbi:MAG TPA: DUF2116 family Zn-ribbon domain-containing protein [Methanothrix sp.]|nr:DUF2116 family Zn-ribbon domain-containing protein [Methanothrix harundinacea]HOO53998.1 DUF2116 family Zn-ribbon domain-containing protein [Methanothrix sp.]HPJ84427.1 DUF2116 family Zn-ribbon domain-containing protein [Methanothrix sp.]HPR67087.1 DUF2116 family Zn-ribbon domain-containing protein [Methanothrix sp.]
MVIGLTKVASHKHCIVCGKTIDEMETFCDEVCESKYKSAQRRQTLFFLVFIGLLILMLIVPVILKTPQG